MCSQGSLFKLYLPQVANQIANSPNSRSLGYAKNNFHEKDEIIYYGPELQADIVYRCEIIQGKGDVKSVYEPSGPSSRRFSRFL